MSLLARLLVVGAGGFLGAALRYAVGAAAVRWLPTTFPFGTFAVNLSGCFAIGALFAWFDQQGSGAAVRLFCLAGVLGGYTTFSAFGLETLLLLRGGRALAAAANVVGQVVAGLLAVALGAALVRRGG